MKNNLLLHSSLPPLVFTPSKKPFSTLWLFLMVCSFLFPYITFIQLFIYNFELFIIFLHWRWSCVTSIAPDIPILLPPFSYNNYMDNFWWNQSLLSQELYHPHFYFSEPGESAPFLIFPCWSDLGPRPWITSFLCLHSLLSTSLWL